MQGAEARLRPIKPKTSDKLLPQDILPEQFNYDTTNVATNRSTTGGAVLEARAGPRAGRRASQDPGYNIINGGSSLGNNVFERFENGMDYRRHR